MTLSKKQLKLFARDLRNDSTPGEIILWKNALRAKQMYGYQFNRQFCIQNYIVDFISRKLKLIIEVDGYSHQFKIEEDLARDNLLNDLGYVVLRIQEYDIKTDFPNVLRLIESVVLDQKQNLGL
ncbi:endonuclease domain-containing protein [Saccharicrinis aurantiacus]|uniref:endonuclease domain-containing protein n=1 Tax=Saccharicrinis aurantiacus TaxID=1849719 RepID=UPI00094FE7E8|nr:DUF559 domain-containing protein [Saccharicrinis aurantiacus]